MDSKLLISYAFIKTLYEKTEDYIDTFCPFVITSISKFKDYINFETVQKEVKNNYGILIPINSLKIIVTRLKRKGLVELLNKEMGVSP